MKLWDLSVCVDMQSTGAAEREALYEFAEMISVRGKHKLIFNERKTRHMYVVTGDLMEKEEIENLWKIEHGDQAKDPVAIELHIDLVPKNINPVEVAGYFGIDAGEIKRMLHEAYGIFADVSGDVVEGIVRGAGGKCSKVAMGKEDIELRVGPNTRRDAEIALAMHEAILQMLKFIPANALDRNKHVETLEKMVDLYLRFRRGLPQD